MNENSEVKGSTATPTSAGKPLWRVIVVPAVIIVAAIVAWWLIVSSETPPPADPPQPPPIETNAGGTLREQFYAGQIEPLLKATAQANDKAAERAVTRINEAFDKYRGGVKPFVEDVTSWSTRFGIVGRMPGDWWYEDDRITSYVQTKFEKHLFSESQLQQDITAVLEAFKEDLEANKNRLLAECRAAIDDEDLPSIKLPDYESYKREVRKIILEFSEQRAKDSVYRGVATFVLSEVAGGAAGYFVSQVLIRIGTTAVTAAAAGGGATAGGAAVGGGGGSLAGPVGTAIGVGVGLVVGIIVDWWMTDRFQERLTNDLTEYIDKLEAGLLDGTDTDAGLKATIDKFVDDLNFAQATVTHRAVVEPYDDNSK